MNCWSRFVLRLQVKITTSTGIFFFINMNRITLYSELLVENRQYSHHEVSFVGILSHCLPRVWMAFTSDFPKYGITFSRVYHITLQTIVISPIQIKRIAVSYKMSVLRYDLLTIFIYKSIYIYYIYLYIILYISYID